MIISTLTIEMAANVARLRQDMDRAQGAVNGAMSNITRAVSVAAGAIAALGLKGVFDSLIEEQEKMQRNMLRTEALLKSNGHAANLSSKQLRVNAQELALATLQSVEGVEQAQQVLLTFTNVTGSTFLRATELAADLATVTGGGLTGSMTMLGKALNDPIAGITAMTRAGVSFTEQQKETIKELVESNKLLDAQTIILDELARQYGGVAKAEATGYAGAIDTLGQRLQELRIGLADYLDVGNRTSVMVNALAGQIDSLTKGLKENAVAVSIGLGALAGAASIAAVAGMSAALGGVVAALAAVKVGFIALTAVMAANPFGLLAIGVGAAAGALIAYNRAQAQTVPGMQRAITDLESANNGLLNVKGQAGMTAAERAGYDERVAKIKELKAAVDTLKAPVITGSVGSGDTAIRRAEAALQAERAKAVADFQERNQTSTQKMNAELKTQRALMGNLFSPEIEAAIRAQYEAKTSGAKGAAAAVAKEAIAYEKLIADINGRIEANGLEAASGDAVTESQKLRIKLDRDMAAGSLKLTAANEQSVRAKLAEFAASESLLSLEKDRVKSMADTLKLIEDTQQTDAKTVAAAIEAATTAEEQLRNYGLLKSEVMSLTLAQLENARESAALAGEDVSNIQKRIEAQQRLVAATRGLEVREAADKTTKDALEVSTKAAADAAAEWQKTADSINQSLTDALMRGFESGKGFAENLRDTLKNMFKTLVLRPIISAVLAPVAGVLTGAANAATGAINGGGDITPMISQLNNSVSGSIEKSFGQFARSSSGQSLGLSESSAMGPLPGGGSLTANGQLASQGLQVLGDTMAGYAMGSMARTMISDGYSMGKGMDNFQKVGIAVGSAIGGPVVGAIAGAVAGVINRTFGRKLKDIGIEGTFGGERGFEGNNFEFMKGGLLRSDKTKRNPLAEEARAALGDAFSAMRVQVGVFATSLGLSTDKIAGFTSSIKLSLKGLSAEAADKKIQEALGTASNALAEQVMGTFRTETFRFGRKGRQTGTREVFEPGEFMRPGELAIDALKRLSGSLMVVNGAFDSLGRTLLQTSLAGGDLASKLADAFGGLENFASATSTYYAAFYSEQERTATATRQLTETLGKLGIALPNTAAADALAQYRALVDAQNINTESGRTAYAALVTLSGGFAELAASTQSMGQAAADAAAEVAKALAATNQGFKDQIDVLRGFETERSLALRDAGDDSTRALMRVVYGLQDLKAASDDAASSAAALASTNRGIQDQLDLLSGAQTERSLALRDAAEDSTKTLLSQLHAQQDIKTAADAAAQAADELKSAMQSVTGTLVGEIKRIRGQLVADSGMGFAATQSQFAITTAQARAGDQAAAKLLPELSQTMLDLAQASATTLVELQRIKGQTANSLEDTTRVLAEQFGLNVPQFAGGTGYAPHDMLTQNHASGVIAPAAFNPATPSMGGNTLRLEAQIERLTAELQGLRSEVRAGVGHSAKTARILERVTPNGVAIATEPATL